jgi:Domain of unknown function (DUF4190)
MIIGLRPVRRNYTRVRAVILIHPDGPTVSRRNSFVATDQKASTLNIDTESPDSPIENELPTYRAISARAIFSVAFGAVAIFCFAHPLFYGAAIIAVVLGVVAHRAIRQHPDMLTGRGLANAGIALGLIFGLGCGTYTAVQYYVQTHMAEAFARRYEQILNTNSLADMLYLNMHPDGRKDQTGDQILKSMEKGKPKDKMMMEQKYGGLLGLNKRLNASKEEHAEFVSIESVGVDEHATDMPVYALAVYSIHGPGNKDFPEKQQYALAILKGRQKGKQYEWWVEDVRFPYTPKSYVAPVAAPDDGHGHAH